MMILKMKWIDFFKKKFLIFLIMSSFFIPPLFFYFKDMGFVFNTSKSLPGFLYVMKRLEGKTLRKIKKGDMIVFHHRLFPNKNLLKKVSHTEGEWFFADPGFSKNLYRPMPSASVPLKHVAVKGDHPQSFDSRYQAFGFVHVDNIIGVAWRII